jgi:hypothetical protein
MRGWAIIAGLIALGACGQVAPPTPLDAASVAAHKAADQFVAMSSSAASTGAAPRQTDATAGPLLNAIFNIAALPTAPVAGAEFDALNDWLNSANRVGMVYILAGTGTSSVTNATTATEQRANSNVITFAPETGRYFDTELAIESLEANSMAQSLATDPGQTSNPKVADGIAKMRAGVAQTAAGVISTLALPGVATDWQEARGKALVAFAPGAAKLLLPTDRASLQTLATQAAGSTSDPTLKAEFAQFATLIAPTGS